MPSRYRRQLHTLLLAPGLMFFSALCPGAAAADEHDGDLAFPQKFMFRIASYSVQDADTNLAVASSSSGVGVGYSFTDDLGGEDSVTIPRIDAYYRFNDRHQIIFTAFTYKLDGRKVLDIDVDLEDESFQVGQTLVSDIRYSLIKVAYGYSFYRTDRVELGVSAGLNINSHEFDFELADGSQGSSSDVSAPLPMFGFRMSYMMTPKWSLHYVTEAFYIRIDDALAGSFTTTELDIQYHFNPKFALGAGLSRHSTNLKADDSDWKGRIADSHRGLLVYASLYLD